MRIRKPLFYMADDAGSAGAGEGGADGSASGGAAATAGKSDDGGKGDEGKTFTQADVDRIIAGRLAKFNDYDEVKQQLTELQQANQTESEKALNKAKDEGRQEARIEAGEQIALEVFTGASGRRNPDYDPSPALELISLRKFVKDDGSVDRDAVKAAVERLVPEKQEAKAAPSFGGGPRKTDTGKTDVKPGMGRLRAAYDTPPK